MKDEIRRWLAEATPGPWSIEGKEIWKRAGCYFGDNPHVYICDADNPANAHLIANSPTWLQWQLDRIEQLEKALEWSAMIIGSGLESDAQLQYDPMKWIQTYHSEWADSGCYARHALEKEKSTAATVDKENH